MTTPIQQLAVLRTALDAEEQLFNHTARCPDCNDLTLCAVAKQRYERAEQLRRAALDQTASHPDLETIMASADLIVRDILQLAAAGRTNDDARAAFRDWIADAILTQPTLRQLDELCRAAGFAGLVDPDTLKARIDELHVTIGRLMTELLERTAQVAALHAASQTVIDRWTHGDLAGSVRQLAALVPQPPMVQHDSNTTQ